MWIYWFFVDIICRIGVGKFVFFDLIDYNDCISFLVSNIYIEVFIFSDVFSVVIIRGIERLIFVVVLNILYFFGV